MNFGFDRPIGFRGEALKKCGRRQGQDVRRMIWSKFEHFPAFTVVLVTCKNEEDPIKNEGVRVLQDNTLIFRHC